jgi:hypothetical protein
VNGRTLILASAFALVSVTANAQTYWGPGYERHSRIVARRRNRGTYRDHLLIMILRPFH